MSAQLDPIEPASPEERIKKQLARELHDQVAQTLTTMLVELEQFKDEQAGRQSVLREVDSLQDSTREVLRNIRQLLYDLRGEPGMEQNFAETIRTGLLRRFEERTGIRILLMVSPSWPERISSTAALNLYRIVQEALNNVRRHSGAREVRVVLSMDDERLIVTVNDDGRGMPAMEEAAEQGMGLMGMRERATLLGGRLSIHSDPGKGTTVMAGFPLEYVL